MLIVLSLNKLNKQCCKYMLKSQKAFLIFFNIINISYKYNIKIFQIQQH